jgi:hypothetical protein
VFSPEVSWTGSYLNRLGQSIVLTVRPAEFDCHVLALAGMMKALSSAVMSVFLRRASAMLTVEAIK